MPCNPTFACFNCRIARKHMPNKCTNCGGPTYYMGTKWRAPKKSNTKAWKKVVDGFPLWESPASKYLPPSREVLMSRLLRLRLHETRNISLLENHLAAGNPLNFSLWRKRLEICRKKLAATNAKINSL